MVRRDLTQEEVDRVLGPREIRRLLRRVSVGIGPPAEGKLRDAVADEPAEHVRVRDAARWPDGLITPENRHRPHAPDPGPSSVGEAIFEGVLRCEKGHHARHVRLVGQVALEVREVLLFCSSDGVVCEEDESPGMREFTHGVVGVDPCVETVGAGKVGPWRSEFHRDPGLRAPEGTDERRRFLGGAVHAGPAPVDREADGS
jgi:hypothetical protein